jgi:glycosyltransferase involved in cell wall biosynthesis
MYSVVIPTLWRSNRTLRLISDLVQCDEVGEVIIIDNSSNTNMVSGRKVKVISNGRNNYVNPSWNIGANEAQYTYLALCNDDINFNANKLFQLQPEHGDIFGIGSSCYDCEVEFDYPSVAPIYTRGYGWGCLMLMRNEDYFPIPDDLRVSYGDDWLFKFTPNKYNIHGIRINTEMSTTSREAEFIAVAEQDSKIWHTLNK